MIALLQAAITTVLAGIVMGLLVYYIWSKRFSKKSNNELAESYQSFDAALDRLTYAVESVDRTFAAPTTGHVVAEEVRPAHQHSPRGPFAVTTVVHNDQRSLGASGEAVFRPLSVRPLNETRTRRRALYGALVPELPEATPLAGEHLVCLRHTKKWSQAQMDAWISPYGPLGDQDNAWSGMGKSFPVTIHLSTNSRMVSTIWGAAFPEGNLAGKRRNPLAAFTR